MKKIIFTAVSLLMLSFIFKINISAQCSPSAPAASALLSPTDGTINIENPAVNLSWNTPASWGTCDGSTGYQVVEIWDFNWNKLVEVSVPFGSAGISNYIWNGVSSMGYYWRVRSANASGLMAFSATWSFKTKPAPTPTPNATLIPTLSPTPNLFCKCLPSRDLGIPPVCSSQCTFEKFSSPEGFMYASEIQCDYKPESYQSSPTLNDLNSWCNSRFRIRGDANSDGVVNLFDYFYFAGAHYGAKLPASVILDFNGDGAVTNVADRAVLIQSLR